ncbi:hypothetical protein D0Y65_006899 [Glycine soja]|uniref:Uncharacterized protein n=1 Tax=Glycine soja TaxID=3848 RepID=A0A445LAV0_GLYSO|nr:hypothetical protein D0Y65_006899 [Glycine soja]
MSSEDTRSYFAWNLEMERVLVNVLRDQRNLGNKDLCAKDRATGLGAENALDADDIMSKEANEEEAIHSVSIDLKGSSSATRKNIRPSKSGEKEEMIFSMKEVAKSLKKFVEMAKKMEIKEAQEVVHEVVNELDNIPNFNGALRHRAIDWLTGNPIKFEIIKALPLGEKEDYISSFMP